MASMSSGSSSVASGGGSANCHFYGGTPRALLDRESVSQVTFIIKIFISSLEIIIVFILWELIFNLIKVGLTKVSTWGELGQAGPKLCS